MAKKLIVLAMTIIMLFSFMGLTSCGNGDDEPAGTFYSLQEAYDQGLLTIQDLQSIAYYHNGDSMSVYPHALSDEVSNAIKEDAAKRYRAFTDTNGAYLYPNAVGDGFTITKYCGVYNACFAIMLNNIYDDSGQPAVMQEVVVAGVTFVYGSGNRIIIWKQQ